MRPMLKTMSIIVFVILKAQANSDSRRYFCFLKQISQSVLGFWSLGRVRSRNTAISVARYCDKYRLFLFHLSVCEPRQKFHGKMGTKSSRRVEEPPLIVTPSHAHPLVLVPAKQPGTKYAEGFKCDICLKSTPSHKRFVTSADALLIEQMVVQ